jgi:hypothetical protein
MKRETYNLMVMTLGSEPHVSLTFELHLRSPTRQFLNVKDNVLVQLFGAQNDGVKQVRLTAFNRMKDSYASRGKASFEWSEDGQLVTMIYCSRCYGP